MSSTMKYWNAFGFFFIVLNYNMTIVGKIWLIYMILMRLLVILFGAYPVYEDELAALVCDSEQPGCSSMCYDAFITVSQVRFWFFEFVSVLIPIAVFVICILHSMVRQVVKIYSIPCTYCKQTKISTIFRGAETIFNDAEKSRITCAAHELAIPDFSHGYAIHLFVRLMIEVGFRISSYCLFGFFVQKFYSCTEEPCSGKITCFIPRSTEKSAMIILLWVVSGFSLVLGLVDLFVAINICRNKRRGTSTAEICRNRLHQEAGPSRDLFNLRSVVVTEDCSNLPQKSYKKERHPAKDLGC
ncbi:gap junction delta-4 protein-like [Crotalus tigris]|uniref:gap junction delta-4 protein-like n=1 Tax=Crotalus tigris TaxID=88082 RepID=UPI00192F60AC|nr:gap junction delta-4 protein-like [Crotalus tigris]XP_039194526.1 gap junction delta-4 protein-like [Crotalus tigris]